MLDYRMRSDRMIEHDAKRSYAAQCIDAAEALAARLSLCKLRTLHFEAMPAILQLDKASR